MSDRARDYPKRFPLILLHQLSLIHFSLALSLVGSWPELGWFLRQHYQLLYSSSLFSPSYLKVQMDLPLPQSVRD